MSGGAQTVRLKGKGRAAETTADYYVSPEGSDTSGDGSAANPWATIAPWRGAGGGVHSTAEGSGGMASVLLGVHGRRATSMAEHAAEAPPGHVQ